MFSQTTYTCLDYILLIHFFSQDPIKIVIVKKKRQIVNIIGVCNLELFDILSEALEYMSLKFVGSMLN